MMKPLIAALALVTLFASPTFARPAARPSTQTEFVFPTHEQLCRSAQTDFCHCRASVTGGDTPVGSGIAAPNRAHVIEARRALYSSAVRPLPADLISNALPQRPSGLNRIKIKSARRARRLQPLAMTVLLQKDDSR